MEIIDISLNHYEEKRFSGKKLTLTGHIESKSNGGKQRRTEATKLFKWLTEQGRGKH